MWLSWTVPDNICFKYLLMAKFMVRASLMAPPNLIRFGEDYTTKSYFLNLLAWINFFPCQTQGMSVSKMLPLKNFPPLTSHVPAGGGDAVVAFLLTLGQTLTCQTLTL